MTVAHILDWLNSSWLGHTTRDVKWLFAAFETIHFIGLSMLMGAMVIVDLRLLGILRRGSLKSVLSYTHFAIVGFVLNLVSGFGCFASSPWTYWENPLFRIKMVLIVVAGLNVFWFETIERRKVVALIEGADTGPDTKLVAGMSLLLWVSIICLGRFLPTMAAT